MGVFLAVGSLVTADDKCGEEIEEKVGKMIEAKFDGKMSAMLKAHDVDGDGHVQISDIEQVFREAGVREECLSMAKDTLAHFETHHDHDNNGKLHHDEMDKWRNADEL